MTHTGNILFTILKSDEYLFCQYILVPSQCLFFDYWTQWDFLVYLFVCLFSPINNIWSSLGLEIVSDSPPLDYLRRVNKVWRSYSRCLWSAISFSVRGWCSPTTPTSCHTRTLLVGGAHTPLNMELIGGDSRQFSRAALRPWSISGRRFVLFLKTVSSRSVCSPSGPLNEKTGGAEPQPPCSGLPAL